MEYVGAVAGGTLGYITGGIRGAKRGSEAGYFFAKKKEMPPIRRQKTTHRGSRTKSAGTGFTPRRVTNPFITPTSRRSSVSTVSSASNRSRSMGNYVRDSGRGGAYRNLGSNASVVKTSGRRVSIKRKRKPKVSKVFKRKVMAALDDHIYGKYLKVSTGNFQPPTGRNLQNTLNFGNLFTPQDIAYSADILFDDAPRKEFPVMADFKWSNKYIRKDYVVNSFSKFEFKNCGQRTYHLFMFECEPKGKPTNAAPDNAYDDWAQGLVNAVAQGTNPETNTLNTLYSLPTDSPQFNQFWKCKKTSIVLGPGESHTFYVQGPNQYCLDYSKLVQTPVGTTPANAFFQSYAKFSRSVFFVNYMDLVTTSTLSNGRLLSGPAGYVGGGLVYEWSTKYVLQCPVSAGFKYPAAFAAGTQQQLDLKKPTKVIAHYTTDALGVVEDVLESNPLSQINPID